MAEINRPPEMTDAAALRIARLERLLQLAKHLRTALSLQELIRVLDDNLPQLFPKSAWELLLPDAMTLDFRLVKHASQQSVAAGRTPLEHSELNRRINRLLTGDPQNASQPPIRQQLLHAGARVDMLPFIDNARVIGVLLVWLPTLATTEVLDDLEAAGEMIGHTLRNVMTYDQLRQQNITDDLTGLFNARHFHHLMDYEIERSRRYGHELSLIFIDLDHFKRINDNYGHLVGSSLLAEVGRLFAQSMRKINLACRYGGDEFAILLPSTPKQGARTLADLLRQTLNSTPLSGGANHAIRVTASFGIASFPDDASDKEGLIQLADAAMYEVKKSGRDGIHCV